MGDLSYYSPARLAWQHFCSHRLSCAALLILAAIVVIAIVGPWLSPYAYEQTDLSHPNAAPSWAHWFGSDDLGRDCFIRGCYGARISLFVGVSAALIDVVVGVLWGAVAAFFGGKVDMVMMRFVDILNSIPQVLMVIFLMVVLTPGLLPILLAIAFTGWLNMARIVRGEILRLKEQPFVLAARSIGAGTGRLLRYHLIPNAIGPILVTTAVTIPNAIFTEAFLSFLGLGIAQPMASWGTMASEGLPALAYYPWRLFFPAVSISVTILSLNIIVEGLREAIDPKMQSASVL